MLLCQGEEEDVLSLGLVIIATNSLNFFSFTFSCLNIFLSPNIQGVETVCL